jgi:uncharacterized membrane protein YczE
MLKENGLVARTALVLSGLANSSMVGKPEVVFGSDLFGCQVVNTRKRPEIGQFPVSPSSV